MPPRCGKTQIQLPWNTLLFESKAGRVRFKRQTFVAHIKCSALSLIVELWKDHSVSLMTSDIPSDLALQQTQTTTITGRQPLHGSEEFSVLIQPYTTEFFNGLKARFPSHKFLHQINMKKW